MRNSLPKHPYENECAIINLDNKTGPGTHWVAYRKFKSNIEYFDSFGNLGPPKELLKYFLQRNLNKNKIIYNYKKFQNYNTYNCGHLCLKFLINTMK